MNSLFSNTDINTNIFSWLTSYNRAVICSVCTLFAVEALRVSKLLASHDKILKELYEHVNVKSEDILGRPLTKSEGINIAADAHLVMRLKSTESRILYGLGYTANMRLIIRIQDVLSQLTSSHERDELFYGAAYGGRFESVSGIISVPFHIADYSAYQAAKGGQIDTVKHLINEYDASMADIIYGGCKINNHDIINLAKEPWIAEYYHGAFIGSAKGGHLDLLKKMHSEAPVISETDIEESMIGALKRGYNDVYEYLRAIQSK